MVIKIRVSLITVALLCCIFADLEARIAIQTIPGADSIKSKTKTDPLNPDYNANPIQDWELKFKDFKYYIYEKAGYVLPYRLHSPALRKNGEKYPLVLFLHGYGERGGDNRKQLFRFRTIPFWDSLQCYVLAPQCPEVDPSNSGGDRWLKTEFNAPSHTMSDKPTWSLKLVMEMLDKVIRENKIDKRRIYITGLSMGGFASWELLQREPGKFAAAIPVCGGADLAFAPELAKVPLWVFHGSADSVVLTKRSRDITAAIRMAGGKSIYTELEGVGHNAWDFSYNRMDVWNWLFKQRKAK